MASEFEIYRSGVHFRWRLKTDREVAAFGELLPTRAAAIRDIEEVKRMISVASIHDTTTEPGTQAGADESRRVAADSGSGTDRSGQHDRPELRAEHVLAGRLD